MKIDRILLVDDDPVSLSETQKLLLGFGYREQFVTDNSDDAIRIASSNHIDVVIMAVSLNNNSNLVNTLDFIKNLLKIPVVLFASQSDEKSLYQVINHHPLGLLIKPIRENVLKETILMSRLYVDREPDSSHSMINSHNSDQYYKELVETVNSIIMRFDPDGNITYINKFGKDFFGFEENELLGQNIVGSILPEFESTGRDLLKMIKSILKTPKNRMTNENENICKNGKRVWVSWTNSGIFDEQGDLLELLCTGHDITKRKNLEKEIEKHTALALANQRRFQAVFDNTYDGIVVIDADTMGINMCNQAFCRIFGYTQEELQLLSIFELHYEKDHSAVVELFLKHVSGDISFTNSLPVKRKNGSRFFIEIKTTLLSLDSQSLIIGIVRDITEIKIQEKGISIAEGFSKTGQWKLEHAKNNMNWSEGVYNILELNPDQTQPSYQTYLESIHPEDRTRVHSAFEYSLDIKEPYEIYTKLLMKDGKTKYIKESCYTEFDTQGKALYSIGIIVDISELRSYQDSIEWQLRVNSILKECMEYSIKKERSLHEMSTIMMDKALELTQSKHGFVASVAKETGAIVGHTITNPIPDSTQCELNDEHRHAVFYPQENGKFIELFGQSVNTRKPFLTNAVTLHPQHRGVPEGHIPVENFVSVPVLVHSRVRCLIAVANSRIPFVKRDVEGLEQLAEMFAISIQTIEAREATRESESRFKVLVESSADWIWETNQSGEVTYSSPRVEEILGLKPEKIVGKSLSDLLPYQRGDQIVSIFDILTSSDTLVENISHSKTHISGDLVYLETNATPVFNNYSELSGYRGISRDITKRKLAELELYSQKIMLQTTLDSIQEAAFLISPLGEILFANQTLATRMNLEDKQVVGINILEQLPPKLADSRKAVGDSALKTGVKQTFEDESDGRFYENMVYPFFDSKTEKKGLAVLSVDITERKIKDQELRMLRRGIEQAPISIVITDNEGTIEYINPFFSKVTGYAGEEIIGKNPRILKSGFHEPSFYQLLWGTISKGHTWVGEMCNRNKTGKLYWEQVSISPVIDKSSEITHYIGIKEDITLKKHLEQVKEDMDRIMRHDLRTPLNSILSYPQLLLKSDNLSERQKKYIKNIKKSGQTMLDMIDLYLNLVKIESGQYTIIPKSYCIMETIHTIVGDLRIFANHKKVKLHLSTHQTNSFQNESIFCIGDRLLTQTALTNLIKNAIEASPENNNVTVDINFCNTEVTIQIKNRGVVPSDIRDRFFQKYATRGKASGTGLGTYSAKLMIDAQNGGIKMETFDDDDITCVTVQLPLDRTTPDVATHSKGI